MVLAVAALLLAGGSGAYLGSNTAAEQRPAVAQHQHHQGHGMTHRAGSPAPFRTVEQLAAAVGCAATINLKAADYRQARCTDLVLLDFDTAQGQRAWLDAAEPYGGVYLVGDRWALSGNSAERIEILQATLGGTIEHQGH